MLDRLLANSSENPDYDYGGTPCWDWLGSLNKRGYGTISIRVVGRRCTLLAHRVSLWTFKHERLYSKRKARHLCHRPCCINPNHLQYGTQKQNVQDAIKRGTFHFLPNTKAHAEAEAKRNGAG